jgi:hypothetical protein
MFNQMHSTKYTLNIRMYVQSDALAQVYIAYSEIWRLYFSLDILGFLPSPEGFEYNRCNSYRIFHMADQYAS